MTPGGFRWGFQMDSLCHVHAGGSFLTLLSKQRRAGRPSERSRTLRQYRDTSKEETCCLWRRSETQRWLLHRGSSSWIYVYQAVTALLTLRFFLKCVSGSICHVFTASLGQISTPKNLLIDQSLCGYVTYSQMLHDPRAALLISCNNMTGRNNIIACNECKC